MRLLISSSSDERTLARDYAAAITVVDPSLEVVHFPHGDIFKSLVRDRFVNRVINRLVPALVFSWMDSKLLRQVEMHKPDIIWLFKGMEFSASTISRLRRQGRVVVNYNADHPVSHFTKGSGNSNVTRSVGSYDLYFTYSHEIASLLAKVHPNLRTRVLPFGHSISDSLFASVVGEHEILRACFVGNPDPERIQFLRAFAEGGIPLDIWGAGWRAFEPRLDIRVNPLVLGDEYWRVLRRYRVQLNLFRPHNRNSHNMRSFEVPACGGIMLAPATVEHLEFFESGKEAYFYNDLADAIMKARFLLSTDKPSVDQIRRAARHRSVTSGYGYIDRARVALAEIQSLL